ncbi:hypothetical protein D3C87_1856190 [compost metagenome]
MPVPEATRLTPERPFFSISRFARAIALSYSAMASGPPEVAEGDAPGSSGDDQAAAAEDRVGQWVGWELEAAVVLVLDRLLDVADLLGLALDRLARGVAVGVGQEVGGQGP